MDTYLFHQVEKLMQVICFSTCAYSPLPNSTHQGIIRTDVGTPTLGFLFSPRFSIFPTLGYYSALGFLFLPPQAIIPPQVFSFSSPRLLFCPRFSLFATLILPQVFSFSHPRLLFCPRFSLFPTLGYYSALGFLFFPPQVTIPPQVQLRMSVSSQHWLEGQPFLFSVP